MLSRLSVSDATGADVLLHGAPNRHLSKAIGLLGVSAIRDTTRPRPTAHGAINDSRWQGGKVVALEGHTTGATIEEAFAEFRTVSGVIVECLEQGPTTLKWTEGDSGLELQMAVKPMGEAQPTLDASQGKTPLVRYPVQFFAEDPRAYSQTLTTVAGGALSAAAGGMTLPVTFPFTFTPSAGGSAAISNIGNRRTPPVLRVYGQAVNPQVLLVETDERIVLNGTVAAGDYLEIDTQRRRVLLNGVTPRNNFINSAQTDWFELPKGGSTVRLLAETFDATARVDVLYRAAYA